VLREYINAKGNKVGEWLQLDFNDRDSQGTFKLKQFHSDIDIPRVLQTLPVREKMDDEKVDKLVEGLHNGEPQLITLEKNGITQQVTIAVNPRLKTLDLLSSKGKKLSLTEAFGGNKEKSQVVDFFHALKNSASRKSGLSVK